MKKILKFIDTVFAKIAIGFIRLYQRTLSPDQGLPSLRLKGKVCAHEPHCSQYGVLTFKRYGFFRGIFKVMDRVYHCRPSFEKKYDPEFYKVVFFCSAPIGVPFLQKLDSDSRFEISGVVTTPDKPIGRGMKIQSNIIKKTALELNIDQEIIQTPEKIRSKSEEGKNFISRLQETKPDYIVVIAYGKIIPQEILDIPNIAPINVHGSLLPEYRGASPIQSVFLDDRKNTGITIMKMDAGLDTGDMIDKLKFPIQFYRTAKDIIDEMQKSGPKFLVDSLRKFGKNMLGPVAQDSELATYCSKIEKESGEIKPFSDSLQEIYKKYRAYFLRPKIYFFMDENFPKHQGKRVAIEELTLDEKLFEIHKNEALFASSNILNPAIQHIKFKPEGKKSLNWEEFLAGYTVS